MFGLTKQKIFMIRPYYLIRVVCEFRSFSQGSQFNRNLYLLSVLKQKLIFIIEQIMRKYMYQAGDLEVPTKMFEWWC